MPTFASAHAFCTSRKAWFKHHLHGGVNIDTINYATKYTINMKAKFSCCEQIKFNEPVLKPGTPGPGCSKPVNANPGLKVNRGNNFSCIKELSIAYVLCRLRLLMLKTEGQKV